MKGGSIGTVRSRRGGLPDVATTGTPRLTGEAEAEGWDDKGVRGSWRFEMEGASAGALEGDEADVLAFCCCCCRGAAACEGK